MTGVGADRSSGSTGSTGEGERADRPSRIADILASVGAPVFYVLSTVGDVFKTFGLAVYYTFRGKKRWDEVINQCYQIGNRSLVFITVVMAFLGMILIFQSGLQVKRITGDFSQMGAVYLPLLIRQFSPIIGALMIATRVGTGIAAEIGSMVVTEQVDALRMNATQPVKYLIVPRFIAGIFMTLVLVVYSTLVSFLAGMLTAHVYFEVPYDTFWDISLVRWADLLIGVTKTLCFGMAIPVVSGQAGLAAFGGSEGVGWATTAAVVNSSLAVIMLDFVVGGVGFMVFPTN
ncbi:MAG: ABC transporter permease [Bradymonadales bacterium]|nr:ABC transporter permease [Bradymonadales bacterium]